MWSKQPGQFLHSIGNLGAKSYPCTSGDATRRGEYSATPSCASQASWPTTRTPSRQCMLTVGQACTQSTFFLNTHSHMHCLLDVSPVVPRPKSLKSMKLPNIGTQVSLWCNEDKPSISQRLAGRTYAREPQGSGASHIFAILRHEPGVGDLPSIDSLGAC